MRTKMIPAVLATVAGALLVAGCGGSSGGGDGNTSSTGTVNFAATDAPAAGLEEVQITFDKIVLKPKGDPKQIIEIVPPKTIDLLKLTGDASEPILDHPVTVPAGKYTWIRLFVIGGVKEPSGQATELGGSFVKEGSSAPLCARKG